MRNKPAASAPQWLSMATVAPARYVAGQTLETVQREPLALAADVLARLTAQQQLRDDDVRLARTLVFGVLRHALTLDYFFKPHLKQTPEKLDPRLRIILRMATYQKFFLSKVPDYAIGNEMVELAKMLFRMKSPQVGFLNAVLRRIMAASESPELPLGNRVRDLAVRYSVPVYPAGLFVSKYGTHKAMAIMEACNQEPLMTLRVNRLKLTREELISALEQSGFQVQPGLIAPDSLVLTSFSGCGTLFETELFQNGAFYVQDEGSQLVAHLVAPAAGERVLDLCSAPGGKTTHMAELAGGNADISATDLSEQRLKLVVDNVERLSTPGVIVKPMSEILETTEPYDAVLVDAPCSGMGTIRRNPEIKYRITPEELARQAERQGSVLEQAAPLVRPGGRLVYSTCSVSDKENRDVIRKFQREHPEFAVQGKADDCAREEIWPLQREDGVFATWPLYPELDGFEAVVLVRQ